MFSYSYRNTSGSLGEREIEVETLACRACNSTQNFHECFYNVFLSQKKIFISFIKYKVTRRKLKHGNNLYQSVNACQSKLTFSEMLFYNIKYFTFYSLYKIIKL